MKALLLILLFTPILAYPQKAFNAGVHAGFLGSQVSGDYTAGFHKPGFNVGFVSVLPLRDGKSFQFEINYIQKGSRLWPNPSKYNYNSYMLKINYVEVPFTWTIPISGFNVEGGLSVSKSLSVKEADQFGTFTPFVSMHYAELGLVLGVQKQINSNVLFKMRYANSITPLRPHFSGVTQWYNWGQYHSLVAFELYYLFKTY